MLGEMYGKIIETKLTFTLWDGDETYQVDLPLVTGQPMESTDGQVGRCIKECIRDACDHSRAKIPQRKTLRKQHK